MNKEVFDTYGVSLTLKQTGLLLKLIVQDDDLWKPRYKSLTAIHNNFKFSIEDVNPASYNSSYFVLQNNIYLALNFSTDFNNKELKINTDPMNPTLVSDIEPQKSLTLINNQRKIPVSGRE
jgi:hypothetical protein